MSDGKEEATHPDTDSDTDDAPQAPAEATPATAVTTAAAAAAAATATDPSPWRDVEPPPPYEPEKSWLCCTTYKDASRFKTVLHYLDLTNAQKQIIETRYLRILQHLQKRTRNHAIIFFIGHFIITVGSLFVPALLSIQNSDKEYAPTTGPFNVHVYWTTFVISLLVTMWNAILTLFRIDKKYYFLNTTLERLRSEGWQYVSLTGRYSGHLTKKKPTHKNQFVYFAHYVERIKMKQIEEEYYRTDEKSQAPNTGTPTTGTAQTLSSGPPSMINPHTLSPPLPIDRMNDVPREVQSSLDYLKQSHPSMSSSLPHARTASMDVPPVFPTYRMSASTASASTASASTASASTASEPSVAIPITPRRSPFPSARRSLSPSARRSLSPSLFVMKPSVVTAINPPHSTNPIRALRNARNLPIMPATPIPIQSRPVTPPPSAPRNT
jgi:hypothetical protein